jgi:hypothetical protein
MVLNGPAVLVKLSYIPSKSIYIFSTAGHSSYHVVQYSTMFKERYLNVCIKTHFHVKALVVIHLKGQKNLSDNTETVVQLEAIKREKFYAGGISFSFLERGFRAQNILQTTAI